MSGRLCILVGTMTGTAELVAEDMQAAIAADGAFEAELLLLDDVEPDVFADQDRTYLIVTSTYGQGDVPDNAMDFYEALESERPDLSNIRFGVFGLGDSTYGDTYNHGGERFERLLKELGATLIGRRYAHDAGSVEMPEDKGVEWVKDWIALI